MWKLTPDDKEKGQEGWLYRCSRLPAWGRGPGNAGQEASSATWHEDGYHQLHHNVTFIPSWPPATGLAQILLTWRKEDLLLQEGTWWQYKHFLYAFLQTQRAVCRFKRRTLWKMHHFHQQNFCNVDGIARASAFKAAIINYLWCSEENVFLLRMMTNHPPKWITFWSVGRESFFYELFSASLTGYSLKNVVHWKLRYPNCCDSFFWYFKY